jgi:hypothetical protein
MLETGSPSGGLAMSFSFLLVKFDLCKYIDTDYGGLAAEDMKFLRSLKHWNLWFESRSRHGCLSTLICIYVR